MNTLQRTVVPLISVLALFSSALASGGSPIVLKTIDQVTSTPRLYDGKAIRVDACLFVTRHGMALYNCNWRPGQDARLVSFEPIDKQHDKAYRHLVKAGFASHYKDLVLVTITGEFQFSPAKKPNYVLKVSGATNFRTLRDPEL